MSAHTPGPWEVVRHNHVDGELWLSVNQQANSQGMKEWIAEIKYLTTDMPRQWANARLIAAAPDLLTVVRECVSFRDWMIRCGGAREPLPQQTIEQFAAVQLELMTRAIALIAQIEGEG